MEDRPTTLNTREAAQLAGVTEWWLARARREGYGPPFMAYGPRTIRYLESDVRAWMEQARNKAAA